MQENSEFICKQLKDESTNIFEDFKEEDKNPNKKERLLFLVKQGLDSFLDDIIEGLYEEYETRKIIVTEYWQIDEGMKWADICWFEWCDELIAYGSKLDLAKEKRIICRLHSYEAFTDYINNVNFDNIDSMVLVCEHIKDFIITKCNIDKGKMIVIPNGINKKKWNFKERKNEFNIAYVGYINYKKGPMLLLHTFKAIYDKDHRYKLYIAGQFQDERYILYYNQIIKEFGLENNVVYEGWQVDLDRWLEDKNYILCTSVLESQNMSIMQAMCKGIKPIIHNFVGAKGIYPSEYVWSTIGEAVDMIKSNEYNSNQYRKYIADNYSNEQQLCKIRQLITKVASDKKNNRVLIEEPLVTVGITNYNYSKFLDKCIESVLNQTYKNIELIIVDDCSVDDSIEKIELYEKKYPNIRAIFHKKNSGSNDRGIQEIVSQAKGKYLMKLDSDDYLDTEDAIYDFIIDLVNDSKLDYVYCNLKIVDIDESYKNIWKYKQFTAEEIIEETFNRSGSGIIPIGTGVYKTDFFRKNNLNWYDDKEMIIAGDTLNALIFVKNNFKYKYIDKELMSYRHHDSNITYDLENRIKSIIRVMEYIINNFSEIMYLKNADWNDLNKETAESKKNYLIGMKYYDTFIMYLNGTGMPWEHDMGFDIEQIKTFVQPLINVTEKYMKRSLKNSNLYSDSIRIVLKEISKYKMDINININKESKEYIMQSQIVDEGKSLRKNLLEKYKDSYKNKHFKFLIYSPVNGYWKYSFLAWQQALNYMGIDADIIYEINPDIDYSSYDTSITIGISDYINNSFRNQSITSIKNKIGIVSVQLNNDEMDLVNVQSCKKFNFKFLISSLVEQTNSSSLYNWINNNINIINIPFGFNPLNYYPENVKKVYDYFFVGTNSYVKYKETEEYLMPILNKYQNGILRGAGWGNNIPELHPNNTNFFYNRSKINLNYHLDMQKQIRNEVNERTFVIASCGGFQLVDNPKLINEFYTEEDMVIVSDEYEYVEKFQYYLNKPLERLEKSHNALVKTYAKECSLFNRLEKILQQII